MQVKMKELGTFEAAREFNVSVVALLNLIYLGKLEARKNEYNRWRITRKSLEAWNKKRRAKRASTRAELSKREAGEGLL
jgi:hypothetical protein